jgi:hypothetical protein
MLWTVLQPSLHRDYFYAVKSRYPNYHFKRISTPSSRALKVWKNLFFLYYFICIFKKKQQEHYHRGFDREESFYLSAINDLQEFRDDDGLTKKSQSSFAQ